MAVNSLPVLMYHYISPWKDSISVPPALFEEHCKALAAKGWQGISLEQAEGFLLSGKPLPAKSVLITFDDGFLDNWVYGAPILKKYGHKGVIFAVASKLEAGTSCRPSIKDVWEGRCAAQDIPAGVDNPFVEHSLGFEERKDPFLNWEEARTLEREGVVRVASHSATHSSVFVSSRWSSFYAPGRRGRTFDRISGEVPWGMPKFEEGPGLANRAFIPSRRLLDTVQGIVPQDKSGAKRFFDDDASVATLRAAIEKLPQELLGAYEDDSAYQARLRHELGEGKKQLEQELGRSERSLCWPWGEFSPEALAIGRELGFRCFFTTEMGANTIGNAEHIYRFKAKEKPAPWLLSRVNIYSRPWLARLYAAMRI